MEILYLDNHLLVVNKPAGQPIQEDQTGDLDLLTEAKTFVGKKFEKPGNVFVGLVHRLDRPVSGVVIFAGTSGAYFGGVACEPLGVCASHAAGKIAIVVTKIL